MNRTLARKIAESVWPSWKITGVIGGGGSGVVYHAVNANNDRLTAAVKIIPIPDESLAEELSLMRAAGAAEEELQGVLRQEADRAAKEAGAMIDLRDSGHIVSIQDFAVVKKADVPGMDPDEEGYYLLIRMEELLSLSKYFASRDGMTEREILEMGVELCDALTLCEKNRIIHRGISASPGPIRPLNRPRRA